jgi:hypothetical protein
MISGAFERLSSFLTCHEQLPLVRRSSLALCFFTMVGWENGDKDEQSASSAENQIPIFYNTHN